jgi:predicted ATPase
LHDQFAAAEAEPEVLAHHFTQTDLTEEAIEWWDKAGEQALRRSAFQEAISHLGKAIEMAAKSGEGTPRGAARDWSRNEERHLSAPTQAENTDQLWPGDAGCAGI